MCVDFPAKEGGGLRALVGRVSPACPTLRLLQCVPESDSSTLFTQ